VTFGSRESDNNAAEKVLAAPENGAARADWQSAKRIHYRWQECAVVYALAFPCDRQ